MNNFQGTGFLSEIELQAEMAEEAANRHRENEGNSNKYEIWGSIQQILKAAANVSKILWPVKIDFQPSKHFGLKVIHHLYRP